MMRFLPHPTQNSSVNNDRKSEFYYKQIAPEAPAGRILEGSYRYVRPDRAPRRPGKTPRIYMQSRRLLRPRGTTIAPDHRACRFLRNHVQRNSFPTHLHYTLRIRPSATRPAHNFIVADPAMPERHRCLPRHPYLDADLATTTTWQDCITQSFEIT